MDWLEQELQQALERKDPSPDFTARVTAAAARGGVTKVVPMPGAVRTALPRWLPVAAAIVLAAGSGIAYREHQGRVAKDQVMLAMRITAGKLNHIQAHVREAQQ